MSSPDAQALSLIGAVEPTFTGLVRGGDAVSLPGRWILHAGPPIAAENLPMPVLNSVAVAIIFEGWADSQAAAEELLLGGDIALAPAQDYSVVVPLASVLSPSMWVQEVCDRRIGKPRVYSPINGGSGPALRLGLPGGEVLSHLQWLNGDFADWLSAALPESGLSLIPIADYGLEQGDDCHGRTGAATERLVKILCAGDAADGRIQSFLRAGPSFFLNLWMAATKCMLLGGAGVGGSSVIVAAGGNGVEFGIQVAARPGDWIVTAASVPHGVYDPGYGEVDGIGAIGDSAVVDIFGLGAMAAAFSPAQAEALEPVLPEDFHRFPAKLLSAVHRDFESVSPLYGLTAQRVVDSDLSPIIALGILDNTGAYGRIGGGIYRPPVALFKQAMACLDSPTGLSDARTE